jgi:repressor LexA
VLFRSPEIIKVTQRNFSDLLGTYNIKKYQPLPSEILNVSKECFMMYCPDNSLFESGITYDDMLVISPDSELKDGDIVLVLYENHLVLRKYYLNANNNLVKLKADSDLFKKEIFNRHEVKIIGKLVAKITKYP